MPILSESTIAQLVAPYTSEGVRLAPKLSAYLDLLLRWNARTNLTAIRQPEEVVRRHFGESLFAAAHLCSTWNTPAPYGILQASPTNSESRPAEAPREAVDAPESGLPVTLLDLGSGAGFPGLPIALAHPQIAVTLAESQGKKASFLREAVRTLELSNVEVWAARVETLPPDRRFHTVALRAVDNMAAALAAAGPLAEVQLILLTTGSPALPEGFTREASLAIPGSDNGVLVRAVRTVPRGTVTS